MQKLSILYLSSPFLTSPHESGILLFVLGIIFILTIYHFLLFFQHKSKTYIYYALYTCLLFLAYFTFTKKDFLAESTLPVKDFFFTTHEYWVWLYNLAYYLFAFSFLNFKKHHKRQTKIINKILLGLFSLGTISFLVTLVQNDNSLLSQLYLSIYIPLIIILTLYCFYLVYKTPEKTKNYILGGSFILFLSSILTILIVQLKFFTQNEEIGFLIFYVGIIIENIFFSLGIGMRQKEIIIERNEAQHKLIIKLKENEDLKGKINNQLQEKIIVLNNQIKLREELETLKLNAFKSQMNPHFIFNALNSIKLYIINNESKKAAHYLNKFSKLIRKILQASDQKEISLSEELETMNLYMTIENIRFSNEIDFSIQVNSNINLNTIKFPPLLLQPFLENSLWHGLSSKKGDKKIVLLINKPTNSAIDISIEDNGIGREASARIKSEKSIKRKSIGINLTRNRLDNFVKDLQNSYAITYQDLKENNNVLGTKVIISFPLF